MRTLNITMILAFMVFLTISMSYADIITFDDYDINVCPGYEKLTKYTGFEWNNFFVYNTDLLNSYLDPDCGYFPGAVSGNQAILNGWGNDALILSEKEFDFIGAYLTSAWNDNLQIEVQGLSDGVVLYSTTVTVSTGKATWFDFAFDKIDGLVFSSFGGTGAGYDGMGTHFILDNFTCSVPEPSSLSMLFISLLGITGVAIKRGKGKYLNP